MKKFLTHSSNGIVSVDLTTFVSLKKIQANQKSKQLMGKRFHFFIVAADPSIWNEKTILHKTFKEAVTHLSTLDWVMQNREEQEI